MGILPLKKRINRDKCSFATKQPMFGVFAIDEPGSSVRALYATLCDTKGEAFLTFESQVIAGTDFIKQTDLGSH